MIREAPIFAQIKIVRRSSEAAVAGQALYRLIRQNERVTDRIVKITFLNPSEEVFAFKFD
jgi:hypothetical protein